MADGVKLEIVSPERLVFSDDVSSVTVPGSEGYFTVLGEHAPVMSILKPGFVTVGSGPEAKIFYVGGGFADVSPAAVTILAEESRLLNEFDKEEVQRALSDAQNQLSAAESIEEKDAAQLVVHSLENLMAEVENMGPAVQI